MCAWRLKTGGGAGGVGSTLGGVSSGVFDMSSYAGGVPPISSLASAGALLRQNAARVGPGAGGGGVVVTDEDVYDEEDDEEFDEEEEEYEDAAQHGPSASTHVPALQLPSRGAGQEGGGFGQARPLTSSMAGALLQSAAQQQQQQQQQQQGRRPIGAAAAAAVAQLRKPQLAGLSRQLFKDADARSRAEEHGALDDDEDDEELDELQPEDREFVLNTRELFQDVDAELLAESFVPHEHVVGVIASDTGDEASPAEIEENLSQYSDLMEEIDLYLGNYIETHHDEFNAAISDFSEMILAVSGSDDTLARLKKDLVLGATSLETHAEQLRVLRVRAAKSLYMREMLQSLQDAVAVEAEIRQLIASRHFLRAVQLLQHHRATLQSESMRQVRATGGLREFMEATLANVHSQVVDELLSCVFRQEMLAEADAELVTQLMRSDEADAAGAAGDAAGGGSRVGGGRGSTGGAVNGSAPSVRQMVQRYWNRSSHHGGRGVSAVGTAEEGEDAESGEDGDGQVGRRGSAAPGKRPRGTLADIVESFFDDPDDELLTKDYLKFIPLCVKSLLLLDRLDSCHEALFSRATKCIERFISHFLRLYDAWRRRIVSGTTLAGSDGGAAVRAIKIRAFDLTSDLVSTEEAIATVQARELRTMLSALFTELEKIVRNANYLVKIVAVARFPFLSEFIVQPIPFDAERTSREWDLLDEPLGGRIALVREVVAQAEREVVASIRTRLAKASRPGASMTSTTSSANSGVETAGDSSSTAAAMTGLDLYGLWDKLLEFASIDKLLQRYTTPTSTTHPAPGADSGSRRGSLTLLPTDASPAAPRITLTLRGIHTFLEEAVASTLAKYGRAGADGSSGLTLVEEQALRDMRATLAEGIRDGVRTAFVEDVKALLLQWDLRALWAQLNYHVEFVFHVLCDAKEAEDDGDDLVTLVPFLRQKNLVHRVQRTAASMREADARASEEAPTLEKLLSTYHSSTGMLRMLEETGSISFSLVGAVKRAQAEIRKGNEGQARQYQAMQSDTAKLLALSDPRNVSAGADGAATGGGGGGGGAGAPLVLLNASALRHWFVFTAMNVLTCYGCAERFCERCSDRVPEFRLLNPDESVLGFFKRFARTTYIPTLHAFHSQQLQQLCLSMGDTEELTAAAIHATGSSAVGGARGGGSGSGDGGGAAVDGSIAGAPPPPPLVKSSSSVWPTVTVSGTAYPILACVHYVGQVLEKVSGIRGVLPSSLAEDVERSTGEALTEELAAFLKRKLQLLGRGTIQYRLLNSAFEDAFALMPNRRWQALCSETNMWDAHRLIDVDLYRYYQHSSAQRTSGHEYNRLGPVAMEALSALENDADTELDEKIGLIPAEDLCVRDDSSLVALAVLSYSVEWLCDALLRNLWPGARRYDDYMDSCVPGYLFSSQLNVADAPTFAVQEKDRMAHQKVRLSGSLSRLCALAQASLFYLSVEARFLAFCFIPQLRDESYNIVATSASADTFVEAYSRRVSKMFMLLRQHLHPKKIKYTCLTIGKPASELVVLELAHLRDKAISEAGMARLRTDLLVMQTALQLILPTDLDVRSAVSRYFGRPAVFVRYIPNRDVVNELLSSGDYRRFTLGECEELIRLVFRQVTGANDDSMARANIDLFHKKLRAMDALRTGAGSDADSHEEEEEEEDEEDEDEDGGFASLVVMQTALRKVDAGVRLTHPVGPPTPAPGKATPSAATMSATAAATATTGRPPPPPPPPAAKPTAALSGSPAATRPSAAIPSASESDEEYEEDEEGSDTYEEVEEEEEEEEKKPQAPPAVRPVAAAPPVPRPTGTTVAALPTTTTTAAAAAKTAAGRASYPLVPPIAIPARPAGAGAVKQSTPAPAPAAAAAVSEEEESSEYYYEEETEEEEEETEEDEAAVPHAVARRR